MVEQSKTYEATYLINSPDVWPATITEKDRFFSPDDSNAIRKAYESRDKIKEKYPYAIEISLYCIDEIRPVSLAT